jgi:polyisoprenoid-binding protein YceI
MNARAVAPALFGVVLAFALAPPPLAAAVVRYTVDPSHSSAGFSVRHFVSRVPGRFDALSGTIAYDADDPAASSVEITVDATSVDTNNPQRDDHLRSPDFFDVDRFPTLSFKSVAVKGAGDGSLEVSGDLTIRGVTKRVTVPVAVLGVLGDRAGFEARFTVDRQDYGVSWNRVLDGGAVVGDEVAIELEIEARRERSPPPAAPPGAGGS